MIRTLYLCGDTSEHFFATSKFLVSFLPVTTHFAPNFENKMTVDSPIPELEPVTKTTLLSKFLFKDITETLLRSICSLISKV
jgi:hypothetical protein